MQKLPKINSSFYKQTNILLILSTIASNLFLLSSCLQYVRERFALSGTHKGCRYGAKIQNCPS